MGLSWLISRPCCSISTQVLTKYLFLYTLDHDWISNSAIRILTKVSESLRHAAVFGHSIVKTTANSECCLPTRTKLPDHLFSRDLNTRQLASFLGRCGGHPERHQRHLPLKHRDHAGLVERLRVDREVRHVAEPLAPVCAYQRRAKRVRIKTVSQLFVFYMHRVAHNCPGPDPSMLLPRGTAGSHQSRTAPLESRHEGG